MNDAGGGRATSDPRAGRAPPPLAGGQRLRQAGRGANPGWPTAAAALSGGGGLRRARGRPGARRGRLLSLGVLRGRPPASAAPPRPAGPGLQTAPLPRPLTPGLTLSVLLGACRTGHLRQSAASRGGPRAQSSASANRTRLPAQLRPHERVNGRESAVTSRD